MEGTSAFWFQQIQSVEKKTGILWQTGTHIPAGIKKYIWRTQGDERVRESHQDNEGEICEWGSAASHPGDEINCRCWPEPVLDDAEVEDDAIEPSYILEKLIFILAGGGLARWLGIEIIRGAGGKLPKPGNDVFKRPEGVPRDWVQRPTKKGEGVKYIDPKNPHNYIRVSKGNPNSSNPGQRTDYVRWQKNGESLDKNGNPVYPQSKEAHIPVEDFIFKPEVFE